MEICGAIKSYDWGRLGSESKVATLALANGAKPGQDIVDGTPYAELWMGDHVSGSATFKATGETLRSFIEANKSSIGGRDNLPFLLKVLSIQKPLSIQVHPNKQQAEHLHATYPDIYKDPNHKPELAIALTDFLALCGFRTAADLYAQLNTYEALVELLGTDVIEQLKTNPTEESCKVCYTKLMHSPQASVNDCIAKLDTILGANAEQNLIAKVFQLANTNFPNDVGTLSIFFLNILQLKPGDAIYLAANVPHAYLSGDCIECMACSDNVIRAGLTPKFKDVNTLLDNLDYSGSSAEQRFFNPTNIGPYTQLFSPPVKDFAVVKVAVPAGVDQHAIDNHPLGSILLVLDGTAEANDKTLLLKQGSILFLPADVQKLELKITSSNGLVAYQALYNEF